MNDKYMKINFVKLSIIVLELLVIFGLYVLELQEKKKCAEWIYQEKNYPRFKPSEQMVEQCSYYGLNFKP